MSDGRGRCPVCLRMQSLTDTGLISAHRRDGYICSGSALEPDTAYQPSLRRSVEGAGGQGSGYHPIDDQIWRVAGRAMDD